ncbi:MAG TPA: hypothetical protein VNH53_03935 [Sphingomicrobium sp.]|nr:hypothetical protein [Sphingomicrobium sp.]
MSEAVEIGLAALVVGNISGVVTALLVGQPDTAILFLVGLVAAAGTLAAFYRLRRMW